jgi:hypothetical protein
LIKRWHSSTGESVAPWDNCYTAAVSWFSEETVPVVVKK